MILIRLKRQSHSTTLSYAIIVSNHTSSPASGKFLEKIGFYKPLSDKWSNRYVFVDVDRLSFWLEKGAKINPSVFLLIKTLLENRKLQYFDIKRN